MKNSIWVGKNTLDGNVFLAKSKMIVDRNGYVVEADDSGELYLADYLVNFFGLNLKNGEIVELTYDTETGKVEVKLPREIGWYLGYLAKEVKAWQYASAYHWDGVTFSVGRDKELGFKVFDEDEVTLISGKLPDNPYLKSLE